MWCGSGLARCRMRVSATSSKSRARSARQQVAHGDARRALRAKQIGERRAVEALQDAGVLPGTSRSSAPGAHLWVCRRRVHLGDRAPHQHAVRRRRCWRVRAIGGRTPLFPRARHARAGDRNPVTPARRPRTALCINCAAPELARSARRGRREGGARRSRPTAFVRRAAADIVVLLRRRRAFQLASAAPSSDASSSTPAKCNRRGARRCRSSGLGNRARGGRRRRRRSRTAASSACSCSRARGPSAARSPLLPPPPAAGAASAATSFSCRPPRRRSAVAALSALPATALAHAAHRPAHLARAQSPARSSAWRSASRSASFCAICVFCVLKSCGKKEVGGCLASAPPARGRAGAEQQAGRRASGQELVVKTSSPAAAPGAPKCGPRQSLASMPVCAPRP